MRSLALAFVVGSSLVATPTFANEVLVPRVGWLHAPTSKQVTLTVAPVQLDAIGSSAAMTVTLPVAGITHKVDLHRDQREDAHLHLSRDPGAELARLKGRYESVAQHQETVPTRVEYVAVPALPFGSFLVTIGNLADQPLVVSPKQLSLAVGDKTIAALSEASTLDARWERTVAAMIGAESNHQLYLGPAAWHVHDALRVLSGRLTIPPHGSWSGYVVFDTRTYTLAEYDAFLRDARQLEVKLDLGVGTPDAVRFSTTS